MVVQGREIKESDLEQIRHLMRENPSWHRTRLSRELCRGWQWHNGKGQLKDMACRSLLLKLNRRGLIELPARAWENYNHRRGGGQSDVLHSTEPIKAHLGSLSPIELVEIHKERTYEELFACLLCRYHYLGYRDSIGENVKYLAMDKEQRPLGCLLFDAAAWKAKARDSFIGWDEQGRQKNLSLLCQN